MLGVLVADSIESVLTDSGSCVFIRATGAFSGEVVAREVLVFA